MTELPLSPMLVQYLVGLCCLRWNAEAVDITIGDLVYDEGAQKQRDVDVTVTVVEGANMRAFKAYEVKREGPPLDVVTTEQLCIKLLDMPALTHRAIVSSSGFTDGAKRKAKRHGVDLYVLRRWTRPLKEQFPAFEMDGIPEHCFPFSKMLLCWPSSQITLVAKQASGPFTVESTGRLFSQAGVQHPQFANFADYRNELLLRSTEILFSLEPAATIGRTFPIPFSAPDGEVPAGPAWPHTHTLDVSSDGVHVQTSDGLVCLDQITISGHLQWQRSIGSHNYYVIERVPTGEALAGALVSIEHRAGQMTCLTFAPTSRQVNIEFVRLSERHQNAIRDLKLRLPSAERDI